MVITTATLVWTIMQCYNGTSVYGFLAPLSAGSLHGRTTRPSSSPMILPHQHPAFFHYGVRHTSIGTHYHNFFRRTTLLSLAASPSFKSAAEPLLVAGKQLARWGETWIDETRDTKLYGGPLSSAGANIRNAGDHVAQAAASCRFKTGTELIADELREAGTAMDAAADCLQQFVDNDKTDQKKEDRSSVTIGETTKMLLGGLPVGTYRHRHSTAFSLSPLGSPFSHLMFSTIQNHYDHHSITFTTHTFVCLFVCLLVLEPMIAPLRACGRSLEASGAAVLHRQPSSVVGYHLEQAGIALKNPAIIATNDDVDVGGNGMILAGDNLQEKSPAPQTSGSNWMKQQQR
jgi:hypothetical protein